MDAINFGYSMKNIPIPSRYAFKFNLIQKAESTLRTMRWTAHYFLSDKETTGKTKYYIKSRLCPPQIDDMKAFENDVWKMSENVVYRHYTNPFLQQLKADTHKIRISSNAFIPGDKIRNYYEIEPEPCKKILTDNVTKSYRKADPSIPDNINEESQEIACKLNLEKKINTIAEEQCFFLR